MASKEYYRHKGLGEIMYPRQGMPDMAVGNGRVTMVGSSRHGVWYINLPRNMFLEIFEKVEDSED